MDQTALIARLGDDPVGGLVMLLDVNQRTAERWSAGKSVMRQEMIDKVAAHLDAIDRLREHMQNSSDANVLWFLAARSLELIPVD